MPAGMYLVPHDIMALEGYKSYQRALDYYHTLLAIAGKEKKHRLTIGEYAKLQQVEEKEVREFLESNAIPQHKIRRNINKLTCVAKSA